MDVVSQQRYTCSMALNIRNATKEKLAAKLAKLTGETKTDAIANALSERLVRAERERSRCSMADALDEIAIACAARPVLDSRSADEILAYDEHGLPG